MSQTAHKPSHRKPRRSTGHPLLRPGVAGGVLSTIAVTAAAAPSSAEEKDQVTGTIEMPTLTAGLAADAQQAGDATQAVAVRYEAEAARVLAAETAMKKAEARAEAEAERKKAAAEAARERAEREAEARARAARDAERAALATTKTAETAETAENTDSGTTATQAPAGSGNVAALIGFLRAQVGKSYVLGATGPSAYDCSGLTQAAFRQLGISLPRTSQSQSTAGAQVSLDNLQPGDILYWGAAGSAYHVGVYIGGGRFIGAQNSSTGIVERDLSYDPPSGAVRVL
ncbi:C40 family peptidase [Streptomyces sp. TRM 70361]|uniref:C40 family peptidase n=1 Tax=Streptomyces sp. TRM 70361 TaxID=3116553 RepID=UPI002E7C0DFB|nr:C40 family peptidase [Streptomyces sp. TRM 70361]MEE1940438.1 C40 family peptidase [Streptomyces sp. TRM 70361]